MRRAALYHRVSTRDQNPTLARDELRRAAAARDLEVVLDIEETGSGRRNDRPGLQRVVDAALRHHIDFLLVWKVSRFGRSALDLLTNVRRITDAGVVFIATTQGLEMGHHNAMANLMITFLAGIAEFERETIVEQTLLGLAAARKAGRQLGRPRSTSGPSPQKVLELRKASKSWRAIAAELGCAEFQARRAAKRGAERSDGSSSEKQGAA